MEEDDNLIVLDVGSYTMKAGFAGKDEPHSVFPLLIGDTKVTDPTG